MKAIDTLRAGLEQLFPKSKRADALADALVSEAEEERRAQRQALAFELDAVTAREAAAVHAFEPVRRIAQATVAETRAELLAAEASLHRLETQHRSDVFAMGLQADRLRIQLRATASPIISAFVEELRGLRLDTFRSSDADTRTMVDGSTKQTWSNHADVARRAEAIQVAISAAEALTTAPLSDAELLERFDTLRAGLPELDARPAPVAGVFSPAVAQAVR